MNSFSAPPLPPGWTEHVGPAGQPYYYHAGTRESTYVRPLPAFPIIPQAIIPQPPKKKDKPSVKTPIPGTEWLRVTTTEGNIFYSHKAKKQSVWTVPEEIKDALEAFERAEKHEDAQKQQQEAKGKDVEKLGFEEEQELKRIKTEMQSLVKRKAEEPQPLDEVVISKKARVEEEAEGEEEEGDEEGEDDDDESEEEEWQREAAAQLAAEAEEEKKRLEEEAKFAQEAEDTETKKMQENERSQLNMPDRVDLSIEEAKALFKTLLREKDISPLHPWDTSLPLFISDPRYVLLPSVSARRDAFDEYCRDRARELRQQNVKKEKAEANPKEEYERLLSQEVKSTRTSWSDFRRTWKKDRRFYGWGRDDREREKRFKEYLKELGEKKRIAAEKAEADFFTLLRESGVVRSDSLWKDVKRKLSHDARYDAVGSSSLREELFQTFLKAHGSSSSHSTSPKVTDETGKHDTEEDAEQKRRDKKEQALKEREQKVRADRSRMDAEIGRSKMGLNLEEGEREFRTLLTDAVRDPQATWESIRPQLQTDPRFNNSPLPVNQQLHLFHTHMSQLQMKHLAGLHSLFQAHAPSLATPFSALPLESILKSLPVTKLAFDTRGLQQEYEKWQRERTYECRKAFDEMLAENSFVEFWGRLGKIGGEGVEGGVKADDLGEDEGEGFGGKVDMKALAKSVDLSDIEKVLKNDKRYIMFEHVAAQRERWLRVRFHTSINSCRTAVGPQSTRQETNSRSQLTHSTMRLLSPLILSLTALSSCVFAQDAGVNKVKYDYQSDVARLRKIVVNSLYSNRDVFLRELISNANDALEKLRLTALTEKSIWDGVSPLNLTIKTEKDPNGEGGRIIITDTGIGMSAAELTTNLGTLAKSGTSDFLAGVDGDDSTATGNLIGAFGLGFYSSFLVADKVTVASLSPPSSKNHNPIQNVFSSSADEGSFEIYPDPRGNTLGHGTEITLYLKSDASHYLVTSNLMKLVNQHSGFSTAFPIYIWYEAEEEVPDVDEEVVLNEQEEKSTDVDEDEAVVEEDAEKESASPKMKKVIVGHWEHLNAQPPLWMRDSKTVTDEEYELLYQATFKDFQKPLAWHHFHGDSESGVSFHALIYIPSRLTEEFFNKPLDNSAKDVRLLVKHVFITSDLGEYGLPKWASWVKVIIDADDLPLNVSRETLQSSSFLKQIKQIILRRLIQLFSKIAEEDQEKYAEITKHYGQVLKLAASEDSKNRQKLAALVRFDTNQREAVSFDSYLENRKQGQKQIFYLADMGKSIDHLSQSVFVEKLHARGYEVLLLNEPLDEIMLQSIRNWKGVPFQDVAKAGLDFGDDTQEEKDEIAELTDKYAPLLEWLKIEAGDNVKKVIVSNRLVTSPCAIVADSMGFTANVQKLMSALNYRGAQQNDAMQDYMKKQKVLEINPRSPLIEGLLEHVEQLNADGDDKDLDSEAQLKEVTSILIDGALVRSGFEVANSNMFLTRVDRVLRRSLGVSETAPTDNTVKPAPPVDPELPSDIPNPDEVNNNQIQFEMEEIDEHGNVVHDEL
ncbi:Hsp90 protein-domain-containing protein [Suillus plorans]|uniref:Hsp90 protein-domain-containing protein n=1 Tax=Suillus plorans TaxID=116603 RepID=A0A9P7J7E5_9AGAM|nr:Hsp90 protein-domain-containing protein [Suillus plorans]KAG1806823.1 Hsp90 protein-domain-containing protein [Suillus plorans]